MKKNKWVFVWMVMILLGLPAGVLSVMADEQADPGIQESMDWTEQTEEKIEQETETDETEFFETEDTENEGSETEESETEQPARTLKVEIKIAENTMGSHGFYREPVTLIPVITDGEQPLQEVRWFLFCRLAETGEVLELNGTCNELEAYMEQYGLRMIFPQEKEDMEIPGLLFSAEGSYGIRLVAVDQNGTLAESEECNFVIDRTSPSVHVMELSSASGGHGIYGSHDVPGLSIQVDDQLGREYTSGLDHVAYCIKDTSGSEKRGYLMENGDGDHVDTWQGNLSIDPGEFADGRLEIEISAEDRAGNISGSETAVIYIDTEEPHVYFRFDTSDRLSEIFYSSSKILYITVDEDNFDTACRPVVTTDNEKGYSFSGWKQKKGRTEGTITFFGDGEYSAAFTCIDLAGNKSNTEILGSFIIDQTAPVISVIYDDQQAQNEKYYCAGRKAVVTVEERNFREEDGYLTINCGNGSGSPIVGPWITDGDRHTAEISFEEDGSYLLIAGWKDPAGNEAEEYRSDTFIIDQTEPELTIKGIENHSSNSGRVAPVIHLYDENADGEGIHLLLREASAGQLDIRNMIHTLSLKNGEMLFFDDFKTGMDGIYTLQVSAKDLAGNEKVREIIFSVNRNGSSFKYAEETEQIFKRFFLCQAQDIIVYESNPDWLVYRELSLNCNGQLRELREGADYLLTVTGNEDSWKQYIYTIPAEYFDKEGVYTIHIYTQDRADNYSSSEKMSQRAEFILDYTAPSITVANLEDRAYYHEKEHEFTAVISDNTILESVRYYLDDCLIKTYGREELERREGVLYLKTDSSADYQKIKLEAVDAAGNLAESEEWHILVNTTEQTLRQNRNNREAEEEKEEEKSLPDLNSLILFVGITVAAVIGIGCMVIFIKRKKAKTD